MKCEVCDGHGWVFVRGHEGQTFARCPRCHGHGFWRRLWERVKGLIVK